MKKISLTALILMLTLSIFSQELAGTTIGFSFGPSFLNKSPVDYSLDPGSNNLLTQKLSNKSLVISSVIAIKFGKLSYETKTEGGNKKRTFVKTDVPDNADPTQKKNASFSDRLAFNLGINLAEINSGNISFNKSVDGGIGFGYFLTPNMQLAAFYDVVRLRQMRAYILEQYEGKAIPNGSDVYNALDPSDNKLFYNKTFTGFSLKIVVALNPKKG